MKKVLYVIIVIITISCEMPTIKLDTYYREGIIPKDYIIHSTPKCKMIKKGVGSVLKPFDGKWHSEGYFFGACCTELHDRRANGILHTQTSRRNDRFVNHRGL